MEAGEEGNVLSVSFNTDITASQVIVVFADPEATALYLDVSFEESWF